MNHLSSAACTIVSKNYFAYARSLAQSFKQNHKDMQFFILIVDSDTEGLDRSDDYTIISVLDLPLKGFLRLAFKFDILELNTNVKPTYLSYLLDTYGLSKVIYLDPDIYVFSPLDEIYLRLDTHDIIVTPHSLSQIDDNKTPCEIDFLTTGVFNLGFVAVSNRDEGRSFLKWWENRCLQLGFNDLKYGLFVDQKWVNLAPCFFPSLHILRHPGCNMAYWNLHERTLENKNGNYWVNKDYPLIFFHFSGIDPSKDGQLSKHLDRFELPDRPDLCEIFGFYRSKLKDCQFAIYSKFSYGFGCYSNGRHISTLARRLFSEYENKIHEGNPFDTNGSYYKWLTRKHLFTNYSSPLSLMTVRNFDKKDIKFRLINSIMLITHKFIGTGNYLLLLRYMSFISRLKNQRDIFKYDV